MNENVLLIIVLLAMFSAIIVSVATFVYANKRRNQLRDDINQSVVRGNLTVLTEVTKLQLDEVQKTVGNLPITLSISPITSNKFQMEIVPRDRQTESKVDDVLSESIRLQINLTNLAWFTSIFSMILAFTALILLSRPATIEDILIVAFSLLSFTIIAMYFIYTASRKVKKRVKAKTAIGIQINESVSWILTKADGTIVRSDGSYKTAAAALDDAEKKVAQSLK